MKEKAVLQKLKGRQEKMRPFWERVRKNPRLMVCKLHSTRKEKVRKLRNIHSWRALASLTSEGKCYNQICGWFLCIDAGIDKASWDD